MLGFSLLLGWGEGEGREYGLTARPLRLNSSLLYITRKGLEGGGGIVQIVDGCSYVHCLVIRFHSVRRSVIIFCKDFRVTIGPLINKREYLRVNKTVLGSWINMNNLKTH